MKKVLFTFLLFSLIGSTFGQLQHAWLDTNDVRMRLTSTGYIGYLDTLPRLGYFVPGDSMTSPLFSAGLWIGGKDPQGTVRSFAQMYNIDTYYEGYPGPLAIGTATTTPAISEAYDQVWSVYASDVLLHNAWADCVSDPNCDEALEFPGYTPPTDFSSWPAHGDQDEGQAADLAPFLDRDDNGIYEPGSGDHPCVPGDQALYVIFNDNTYPSEFTGGLPLGLEVHMMAFSYYSDDPAIDQTVFVHYRIINRSDTIYTDVHLGTFADMDIGCPNDDFIGSDVGRNLMFTYNWDDIDLNCSWFPGYGEIPPAFGITVLKGPLLDLNGVDDPNEIALPAYNGTGFGDGIADNERSGMQSFVYFNRDGSVPMTDPTTDQHVYNYLQARWKNGNQMTYGGTGYSSDTSAVTAQFMFPWDTDTMGVGTEGVSMPDWREETPGNLMDRRGIMGSGGFTVPPGAEQEVLYGYVYARAESGTWTEPSVEALKLRVDSVMAFAQTIPGIMAPGSPCEGVITGIEGMNEALMPLRIFPNPATGHINIEGPALHKGKIMLYDLQGSLVAERSIVSMPATIDVQELLAGAYFIRYEMEDAVFFGKFMKE